MCQRERRSWATIDLNQLVRNYEIYKRSLKVDTKVMTVIKANAYGHGDSEVAAALQKHGVSMFAVSNVDEAVTLRQAGITGEILILGYTAADMADVLLEHNIIQTIVSEEHAAALAATGIPVRCQFAIDTGMNRIGLDADNVDACERIIRTYQEKLQICGLFTHFCVADTDQEACVRFTGEQVQKFRAVVDSVADLNLSYIHCCNSAAGIFHLNKGVEFKGIDRIVRLGIILYGLKPDYSNTIPEEIKPVLTWETSVSMVKELNVDETVGYGRTYKATEKRKIATLTTGYADGYNRGLSNCGYVLLHGKRAPIVGRICMDQMTVDVTDIPEARMGDRVTLLGRNGNEIISADDMAQLLGTIGYEVVCCISNRVQRFYI